MKLRKHENAKARLTSRRQDYEKSKLDQRKGFHRPGSMNPHKR